MGVSASILPAQILPAQDPESNAVKKLVLDVVPDFAHFYTDEDPTCDDFERARLIWSNLREEKGGESAKYEYVELLSPLICFYDNFVSHVAKRPNSPLLTKTMAFKSKFVVNLMALLLMVSSATAKFPSSVESFARVYKAEGMEAEECKSDCKSNGEIGRLSRKGGENGEIGRLVDWECLVVA
jgi:hypothetical protein